MNYKNKFVKILIIPLILNGVVLTILAMLLANYDHLQLKQYDFYDENKFTALPDMRLQAKGIIKNVNFDSVIVGSSILANSSAMQASNLLGGTFVNFSTYGSRMYERNFILNYLFKKKKVKNIIYSLDGYYRPKDETSQIDRWELLYDNNMLNDFAVLLDKKYTVGILEYLLSPYFNYDFNAIKHIPMQRKANPANIELFDKPMEWMSMQWNVARFGGLENWVVNLDEYMMADNLLKSIPNTLYDMKNTVRVNKEDVNVEAEKKYIEKYLLRYVQQFPDTKFYIVFPPYYRYYYASRLQAVGKEYFIHQKIVKYIVQKAAKYQNMQVYAFEELEFLDNIKLYSDFIHYHENINDFIAESIASNKHQLNLQNVDAYLAKSKELALKFDIQKLYDDSQKILREHNLPTTWEEYLARN